MNKNRRARSRRRTREIKRLRQNRAGQSHSRLSMKRITTRPKA
jgi:hypothetical protein